jgi:hypothetical protein
MADEQTVRIVEWPKEPAALQHGFDGEQPVPVSIDFDQGASIAVQTPDPIGVDMRMALTARDDVPLCIKICEPICARSEYTIAIDVFDRPVALVTIRGKTTLYACDDK